MNLFEPLEGLSTPPDTLYQGEPFLLIEADVSASKKYSESIPGKLPQLGALTAYMS